MLNERGDDDIPVEGTNDLHTDQLEGDSPVGEGLERANGRLGAEAGVTGWASLPRHSARDYLARAELERHLTGDLSGAGSLE